MFTREHCMEIEYSLENTVWRYSIHYRTLYGDTVFTREHCMEIQYSLACTHATVKLCTYISLNCQTHPTIGLCREHQVVTRRKMEGKSRNLLLVLIHHLKTTVVQGQAAPVGQHILILRRRDRQERRSLKSAEGNTNDGSYTIAMCLTNSKWFQHSTTRPMNALRALIVE